MSLSAPTINFFCQQLSLSIGVHGLEGWIAGLQYVVDRYRRTGARGSGAQLLGTVAQIKSHPFWTALADKNDATDFCDKLESLQGFTCRVKDQHGRTLKRVRVGAVVIAICRATRGPALSNTVATYRVEGAIDLERLPDG